MDQGQRQQNLLWDGPDGLFPDVKLVGASFPDPTVLRSGVVPGQSIHQMWVETEWRRRTCRLVTTDNSNEPLE